MVFASDEDDQMSNCLPQTPTLHCTILLLLALLHKSNQPIMSLSTEEVVTLGKSTALHESVGCQEFQN